MPVIRFDKKLPFKFLDPRAQDGMPEGVKIFAAAALTFWGPPLLYSALVGHALPLYVMAYIETIGVFLGILLYENQSGDNLSCVPANYVPKVPRAARAYKKKDAA